MDLQMTTAAHYIDHLQLIKHPEGGYYKETYRSETKLAKDCLPTTFAGPRNICTAIYYLLEQDDFSAFHKIKSDECWHFYAGQALHIHIIYEDGNYECVHLGSRIDKGECFQFVVPAGAWFASEPAPLTPFALVGCTVAPGFDFEDFEMANSARLIQKFPQHTPIIQRLCRF